MSDNRINWALIQELYKIEDMNFIQEMMIEKSLENAGWTQDRSPTKSEYKKVWALAVALDNDEKEMPKKLQEGYDIIDRHFE